VIGAGIVARLRHIPAFQEARRRGLAELVAICDVYVWKILSRDLRLGREQTELALGEMIHALRGER
jgi:hypothetical protein